IIAWSQMQICWCFFFFFQAEDGIRDKLVTGVQTCALPILRPDWWNVSLGDVNLTAVAVGTIVPVLMHPAEILAAAVWFSLITWRSEERRVGKECRCRGWPDD